DDSLGARRALRARRPDEVRAAAPRAVVGHVPGRAPAAPAEGALRGRLRGRDAAQLLGAPARAEPAARGEGVLGSDARLAVRAGVALLALGLAAVPRGGHPRPPHPPAGARRPADRGRDRIRLLPEAEVPAPARRADGRAPDRLRGRADALVLPLHPVVLPVCGVHGAGLLAGPRAGG